MGLDLEWGGWGELDDTWVEEEEGREGGLKEEVYEVADQDGHQDGEEDTFNEVKVAEYGGFEDGGEAD